MFNGRMKALTFSFDDGVTQDNKMIEILDKYGLKCTFNLNSELLGLNGSLERNGKNISHIKNSAQNVKSIYKNHEVAAHTLTHSILTKLSDEEIVKQVEQDRKNLEILCGKPVVGMAYPGGDAPDCNEHVARIIKENTKIKYARTIGITYNFDLPTNLFAFSSTVYCYRDWDRMLELAKDFIELKSNTPKLFFIRGHAYEFDINNTWEPFEQFCAMISGKNDIFYGTNAEVLFNMAQRAVI